ncbi:MAG: hypothetical protein A2087_03505 [Spirochaetes bacterium GWD1_61_31]|nr:MAG: hypothetical protein A2Y37_11265 [Spirochaetes bacterium GWB1_60_80]OHD36125.1 MAG: hypothetical protein A2087_03505 [Spirochaetes bacterium GWD1_61_31]OHD45011.1 MAG: hypothetical protein A2Y35_13310 [Spirochaetes bacterium GWE1_60_18]HAP43691.1 hypothetical protein [Spirochaetaceae bacterium]HAW86854.1 hypothetical protein [Spirochaetaceae bacterium]
MLYLTACVSQPETAVATGDNPSQPAVVTAAAEPVASPPQLVARIIPLVIRETFSYADGVVDRYFEYEYDDQHRLAVRLTRTVSQSEPLETMRRQYAAEHLTRQQQFNASGELVSTIAYSYDAAGNLVRESLLDGLDRPQTVSLFSWDAAGRRVDWQVFNGEGTLQARSEYAYDAAGQLQSIRLLNGAGVLVETAEYLYRADGLLDGITYASAQGTTVRRVVYAYVNGQRSEETLFRSGTRLERRVVYAVGELGEDLQHQVYDAAGVLREQVTFEYRYVQLAE